MRSELEHKLGATPRKMPVGKAKKEVVICGDCYQQFRAVDYSDPAAALKLHHETGKCPKRRQQEAHP